MTDSDMATDAEVKPESTASTSTTDTLAALHQLQLSLHDPLQKHAYRVEHSGPEHDEYVNRKLSAVERFYVDVANVYSEQLQHKGAGATADGDTTATIELSPHQRLQLQHHEQYVQFPSTQPFKSIEQKLYMTKYQVDNIVGIVDGIIRHKTLALVEAEQEHEEVDDDDGDAADAQTSNASDEKSQQRLQRNRMLLAMQYKQEQYNSAATMLGNAVQQFQQSHTNSSNYTRDIQQLSKYWSLRQRGSTALQINAYTLQPLVVQYRIGSIGLQPIVGELRPERGFSNIHRDDDGHVFLDEHVGQDVHDTEFFAQLSQSIKLEPLQLDAADTDSKRLVGFAACHRQLQHAQVGLVHREVYGTLMKQAIAMTQPQPAAGSKPKHDVDTVQWHVSVQQDEITVAVPGFETVRVRFAHSHRGKFDIVGAEPQHSQAVWLHTVKEILHHHARLAVTADNNNNTNEATGEPMQLVDIVSSVLHHQLLQQVLSVLREWQASHPSIRFVADPIQQLYRRSNSAASGAAVHRYAFQLYTADERWLLDGLLLDTSLRLIYTDIQTDNSSRLPSALPNRLVTNSVDGLRHVLNGLMK